MDWRLEAACIGMEDLFLKRGSDAARIAVCNECPVRWDCLTEAMRLEDYEDVVYGGKTGAQRRQMSEGTVW